MSDVKPQQDKTRMEARDVAQWRQTVQSFFSESWKEIQSVIEALERETAHDEPLASPQADAPAEPAPIAPAAPESAEPRSAPRMPPRETSDWERAGPPPSPSATPSQDARLAELARRIEERLRQSKS